MVNPISFVSDFGLAGLLLITFLSGSIVPLPSDPAILLALSLFNPLYVFVFAWLGLTLGAITNYFIGLKGLHNFLVKRTPGKERKGQRIMKRWGPLILIVAPFLPFIGDPLFIVAGSLKMNFKKFLIFTAVAITIRVSVSVFAGGFILDYLKFL